MSTTTPDTAPVAVGDPDAPLRRPRRPRRRRLSRRAIAFIAGGAALVLVAGSIGGVVWAGHLGHQGALQDARSAHDDQAAALRALTDAQNELTTSSAELTTLLASADQLAGANGAGIDQAATDAFTAARAAITAPAPTGDPAPAPAATPEIDFATASDAQLHDYTDAARAATRAIRTLADDATDQAAPVHDAVTGLQDAIRAYVAATGPALLADRADASDDAKTALQSAIDALASAKAPDLATAITTYQTAADALVASSDAVRSVTADPSSLTAVVNKQRGLPADYVPPGLTTPSFIPSASPVRSELVEPLRRMQADMAAVGIQLRMSSGYRSYDRQKVIYDGFVASEGVAGADLHSARPGNSEHQTGLAVDLDDGTGCNLNACFANAPGGKWLAENAWKYGFILRYGDGWQPIVGYTYEPWHFRYVGDAVAADMHNRGIRTLEEYFGFPAAPDYD